MAHYPHCRVLAIIGSGETSPTTAADAIRDALAAAGLDVSDTPEGTRWQPAGTA